MEVKYLLKLSSYYNNEMYSKKLDLLNSLAVKANSEFPSTITMLLLELYSWVSADLLPNRLSKADKVLNQNSSDHSAIKLAVALDVTSVASFKGLLSSKSSQNIDTIYLKFIPGNDDVENPGYSPAKKFIQKFERCKQLLENGISRVFRFGLITGWPDTGNFGLTSYFHLVNYWKDINEWAEEHNIPVIFNKAFDTPAWAPLLETSGWWRLAESSKYLSSSDYVFIEKSTLIKDEVATPLLKSSRDNSTLLNPTKSCRFSRHNTIVWMNPFLSKEDSQRSFAKSNFRHNLRIVSQKFSKIIVNPFDYKYYNPERNLVFEVPQTIAEHNKDQISKNEQSEPIEMLMTITVKNLTQATNDFDAAVESAKRANLIFPGTIDQILVNAEHVYTIGNLNLLHHAGLHSQGITYGVMLPLTTCNGPTSGNLFKTHITPLLNSSLGVVSLFFIDHVKEYTYSNNYMVSLGVDRVFEKITTTVEKCKKKIDSVTPNNQLVQVGLVTSWSDMVNNRTRNHAPLVNFWEMLNDWADRTAIPVILYEAFDTESNGKYGWWSVENQGPFHEIQEKKISTFITRGLNFTLLSQYSKC